MRKWTPALLSAIVLLPFLWRQGPETRPAAPTERPPARNWTHADLQRLSWLCGTWRQLAGERITEEHWRPVQGSTILGSSHTFDGESTRFFEHLHIALQQGQIHYLAMPLGKPVTAFALRELGDGRAVFENPQHDHPQRIRYERTEAGITASIEQLDGTRGQRFVFTRKPE